MSNHVKTTLCHDITTYDISWQPYRAYKLLSYMPMLLKIAVEFYFQGMHLGRLAMVHGYAHTQRALSHFFLDMPLVCIHAKAHYV